MLGGLAIFLYGLKSLSGGLQEAAGKKVNKILEILTSIPVVGMLVGAGITIAVQSSTLTTVMVVSFVNSAILNLKQAAAVIMGANIGTTFTGHLVAFNVTGMWIYFVFVGFLVFFVAKQKNIKTIGQILFAFGLLLLGLMLMSDAMRPLRTHEAFQNMIILFSNNRFLAMLVGVLFTAVVQSSTAVTGVVILMTMPDPETAESLINIEAALALIIGANIGTCFTAVLASLSGTLAAKRAALIHVILNTFGAVVFLIFMPQFQWAVLAISPEYDVARQAANAHTIFSAVIVIVFLPLINQLVALVVRMIPEGKTAEETSKKGIRYLDWKLVNSSPAVALNLASQEFLYMASLAGKNITLAVDGLLTGKKKKAKKTKNKEKRIDHIGEEILRYLAAISHVSLGRDMSLKHAGLIHAINDIENIGNHARNIAKNSKKIIETGLTFPEEAMDEINDIAKPIKAIFEKAVQAIESHDPYVKSEIKALKAQIDEMEKEMRLAHITRMVEGGISAEDGIIFLEILSDLGQIGNHGVNISQLQ